MKRRKFIALSTAAVSAGRARAAETQKEAPLLSFGLITDVQYADIEPAGERHFRESLPKLEAAVAWLSGKELPFTLHLGDFIDRDFRSFATALPLLDALGHPVHHLLGNHDYTVEDARKADIAATLGMPHDYYSFRSNGVRFVMLDTNSLSAYKHPQGSAADVEGEKLLAKLAADGVAAANPWNGGVSATQLGWLEKELAAAHAAAERVILCGHHPLLPDDAMRTWNSADLLEIIDRHSCVIAYFNGHHHDGAEVILKGVPYITFKSILHQPGVNAFSAIHLFADRLEIEGNGREVSRVIPLKRV